MAFRHGFKAEAERLAADTRDELGLSPYDRLDPHQLAEHLAIPVVPMKTLAATNDLAGLDEAVEVLRGPEREAFSALTVVDGMRRQIVYNDSHDLGRIASSLCHELAHGVLLHEPAPALDERGCRIWNTDYEDEANFLGGALLIPKRLAWSIASRRMSFEKAARQYGCTVEMVRWRVNITGAGKVLAS